MVNAAQARRVTVLNVLNELRPSGAETMLRCSGGEWARHGITARILAIAPSPGPFADELRNAGYEVTSLWDRWPARTVLKFRSELRRAPVDVVHLHAERGNFWLGIIARMSGCAVVRTFHSVFGFSGRLRLERWIQRRILSLLGVQHVSVSASVQEHEQQRFSIRSVVIENWFDAARFTLRTEDERIAARALIVESQGGADPFIIVTIGNCSTIKHHELLARALAQVGTEIEWLWLHLGQEDGDRTERALVRQLAIDERVQFLGYGETSARLLAAADVYVMPSRWEGSGIAAIEAMARGVPVILTDVPGLRDLGQLTDAVVMVPENPTAVASAILDLASQPDLARAAIGSSLAAAVEPRHSMSQNVAAYCAIYRGAHRLRRWRPTQRDH